MIYAREMLEVGEEAISAEDAFDAASEQWAEEFLGWCGVDVLVEHLCKPLAVHGSLGAAKIADRFLANGWKLEKVKP